MAGLYNRDKVKITPMTREKGTGVTTPGTAYTVGAMVENMDEVISDSNGRPVESHAYIFLDPTIGIKKGYKLQIVEQFGETVDEPERLVIKAEKSGGFGLSHTEVYV